VFFNAELAVGGPNRYWIKSMLAKLELAALHESLPDPWRQLLRHGDMSGAGEPGSITDGLDQTPLV
jgi:hypothetical protein